MSFQALDFIWLFFHFIFVLVYYMFNLSSTLYTFNYKLILLNKKLGIPSILAYPEMENYNRQRKHSEETNTFLTMPCVSYARRASTSVETRPGTIFARSPPTFTKAYSSCSIVRRRNYPHIHTHTHIHINVHSTLIDSEGEKIHSLTD